MVEPMFTPSEIEAILGDTTRLESRDDDGLTPLLAALASPLLKTPEKKRLVSRLSEPNRKTSK